MSKLIYGIKDKPKKWYEWIVFTLQQVLAVFVATVLIANICGTPVSSCLLGACLGTLIYQIITKFKSPMFISSCGATVSAVCGALSLNAAENNYLMVFCGGVIILIVYAIFALIIKLCGLQIIKKIFPSTIVGAVTIVIGLNLAMFIPTYTSVAGTHSDIGILVAIFTMLITAIVAWYGKGFMKNVPFLFGIAGGYILALIITAASSVKLVDFSAFNNMTWYPDLTFLQWKASDWSWANLGKVCLYFVPVAVCALLEHYSDHKALSHIIETDLIEDPGLSRTLLGDGVASCIGTAVCGLPNTSYGESIATTGFSRVASVWVITAAAATLGVMSFLGPVQAFVQSIPACVFGGCAMILYGYIAASGLKIIVYADHGKIFEGVRDTKNLIIISVVLTVGVSGIWLFDAAFAGVALAMVLGVILNLILRNPKTDKTESE